MDPAAAKFVGAGLAAMGAGLAAIGVGFIFGSYVQGAFRNPEADGRVSGRLFLGFAVVEALGLIAAVVSLYLAFAK
jgi:F-type H+-transporting ATPase subunit c